MTDCLKGKAHEWRLMTEGSRDEWPVVACSRCDEPGTLIDLDADVGQFYAMRDERDKLQAELEKCQLQAEKSHAAWFHGQEQAEELREELRGECAHNELLQSEMVTMSHELDELKVRADKSARNFHEIQDLLVEQRNAARAELKARDEQCCETCRSWRRAILLPDGVTTAGPCELNGAVWQNDDWCSRWEAKP